MAEVKMEDANVRSVFTLNTWTDDQLAEAAELLADGYWVHFGSTAIGHTRAWMTECEGIEWAKMKYGDKLEIAYREGYEMRYCRLKEVKA